MQNQRETETLTSTVHCGLKHSPLVALFTVVAYLVYLSPLDGIDESLMETAGSWISICRTEGRREGGREEGREGREGGEGGREGREGGRGGRERGREGGK